MRGHLWVVNVMLGVAIVLVISLEKGRVEEKR